MKRLISLLLIASLSGFAQAAPALKMSQLPVVLPSSIATDDSLPFLVNSSRLNRQLKISDLPNTPAFVASLALKANAANPTLTGNVTVSGATASTVPVFDSLKRLVSSGVSAATLAFLDIGSSLTALLALKAPLANPTFTGTVTGAASTWSSTVGVSGVLSANAGFTFFGGPTGFTAELKAANTDGNGSIGFTDFYTGNSSLTFSHRGVGNTGNWLFRNGTDGANTQMSLSSVGALNLPALTASQDVVTDGSKNLISNPITGTGSGVRATSPTIVTPNVTGPVATSGDQTWTSPTTVTGTVSNSAGGTTLTGVGTKFRAEFIVGRTITMNAETRTVATIPSDTSMTTDTWTGANSGVTATRAAVPDFFMYSNGTWQSGGSVNSSSMMVAGVPANTIIATAPSGAATSSPVPALAIFSYTGSASLTAAAPLITMSTAGGTEASPSAVLSGRLLGQITYGGYDSANRRTGAVIQGFTTQDWTTSALGNSLVFKTVPNGSTTSTTALTLGQDQSATFAGRVRLTAETPASAGASCTAGDFTADTGFMYFCTATNTWKRVAIATW